MSLAKAICITAALFSIPVAQAQERRIVREHERERFATPHWVYDGRFHHNHYYPAVGYAVEVLPTGNLAVAFRGGRYWFHSGVWYQQVGPRYVVVRPPVGVLVPVLPPAYSIVYYGGVPYYYANDAYYMQQPTGYEVVAPPETPPQAQPGAAPAAPTAQAPGMWYYCDSAKGYYPYVSQCPEGWRSVPASPPPR
jgi:hypothetical protein